MFSILRAKKLFTGKAKAEAADAGALSLVYSSNLGNDFSFISCPFLPEAEPAATESLPPLPPAPDDAELDAAWGEGKLRRLWR